MLYGNSLLGLRPNALSGRYKTEAQRENIILFEELFNRFSNIAVTRIDWEGLPDSVSERFLNQTLYLYGQAVFFLDDNLGLLALPCTLGGEYNMYYEPTRLEAFSFNFNRSLDYGDFVFVRNNPTCTPTAFPVFEYTRRMADVLRTIDVLCKKMKHPFMFKCDEKERQTYLNLVKKIEDNEEIVLGMKDWDFKKDSFELIPTGITTDLTKLWEIYTHYETLLYTALGIECVGTEKKERLIVDEVNANNMVTEMSIEVTIKELQTACEAINKKYGTEISVKAKGIYEYREGVGLNGDLYDHPSGAIEKGV